MHVVGVVRLTENSYFEIKFFEIDLVTKKFFFDFEFSVSLKNTNSGVRQQWAYANLPITLNLLKTSSVCGASSNSFVKSCPAQCS